MQCLTLLVKEAMLLFLIINNFKTLKYMSLAFDEGFMVSQHYTMYTAGKLHHLFSPKNANRVILFLCKGVKLCPDRKMLKLPPF